MFFLCLLKIRGNKIRSKKMLLSWPSVEAASSARLQARAQTVHSSEPEPKASNFSTLFCRFLAEILSLTLSLFVMYKQHKKLCKISLSILYFLHPISIDDYFAKATLWSFIGSTLLLKRQNMRNETCLKIVSYLLLNANFIFKHYIRSQRKITTERTNVDC